MNHPFDEKFSIPDLLRINVFNLVTEGVGHVSNVRIDAANRLNQLVQELRYEEARLHATLPSHAQEVLKGKNILLFRKTSV